MAETQMRSMTPEEFYVWQLDQDERYELVEGVPVPLRAMTGASNVHDVILVNCIGQLGAICEGGRAGWPAPTGAPHRASNGAPPRCFRRLRASAGRLL